MIVHQDKEQARCQAGCNDGFAGKSSWLVKVSDELSCASGFIERNTARETQGIASRLKRSRLRILRQS